jgi:dodecin
MAEVAKVIEIIGSSEKGWTEAAQTKYRLINCGYRTCEIVTAH